MELYQEMLCKLLETKEIQVVLPSGRESAAELIEKQAYRMLKAIKDVLEEERLDDSECFARMEEIMAVFEAAGSPVRGRHDFG